LSESLSLTPIAFVRAAKALKFDTPHQPVDGAQEQSKIEFVKGHNYEHALHSLAGFDRIWLIWWFHRNSTWRPMVLPPRGKAVKRGVFATRSPHRPNPLGITAVRLLAVERSSLIVGNCDLLDGTPILDIKPYLSTVDAFPDSSLGWLAEVEATKNENKFAVMVSPVARAQLDWLKNEHQIDLETRSIEILSHDPTPHRTRRIVRMNEQEFRLGCGAWRIFFTITCTDSTNESQPKNLVLLQRVAPGYPDDMLNAGTNPRVPYQTAQLEFLTRWPRDNALI